jgi:hypothetical protein
LDRLGKGERHGSPSLCYGEAAFAFALRSKATVKNGGERTHDLIRFSNIFRIRALFARI